MENGPTFVGKYCRPTKIMYHPLEVFNDLLFKGITKLDEHLKTVAQTTPLPFSLFSSPLSLLSSSVTVFRLPFLFLGVLHQYP